MKSFRGLGKGKEKVFLILGVIFMMIMFLIPTKVQADSFRFGMKADKTSIKAGETVTISLSVNDIDAGDAGINTVEGKFVYDNNVFEEVKKSDFTFSNGWSITYNDEETEQKGKFLGVLLQSGTTKNQEIGKVKLKAKSNINVDETVVKMTDIATNNGSDLIKDTDKQVVLKLTKNSSNNDNKNSEKDSQNIDITTKSTTEANKDSNLTYTGSKIVIITILVIAVILIAIFTFRKYKSVKKQ